MARSSVRRAYDSSARTRRIAIIAGIAVFVLVWIGVVIWLGRMGSVAESEQASSEVPAETTAQNEPEQIAGDGSAPAEQGSEAQDTGQGSAEQQDAQESGQPIQQEGSVPQGTFDPLEEEGSSQPEGSSASEESEQVEPPSEAEIDTTRARTASERYIVAAYGYTGSDEEEYLSAIEQAASEEIYDSPGGQQLKDYAKAAPQCGMKSTAILEGFEVVGQSGEGMDVSVTFSVEDGSSDSSDGQTHTFRQNQRLSMTNGVYEVSGVSVEELISRTTPTESCPGAQANERAGTEQAANGSSSEEAGAVSDERQVRSAAGRFISAAYGYTGNSTQDYRAGVERTTITGELLKSPGGERIKDYSETAGKEGIKSAAKLQRFEVTSQSGEEVEGVAYFDVGRSYDRYGAIKGDTTPYRQELTLVPYEGSYRVSSASGEQQIEGESENSAPANSRPADSGERKLTS